MPGWSLNLHYSAAVNSFEIRFVNSNPQASCLYILPSLEFHCLVLSIGSGIFYLLTMQVLGDSFPTS